MESYEKVLIEWTSVKDNLTCDDGVQAEDTELFKLVTKKYAGTIVEAFINARLANDAQLNEDV